MICQILLLAVKIAAKRMVCCLLLAVFVDMLVGCSTDEAHIATHRLVSTSIETRITRQFCVQPGGWFLR